MNIEDLRDHIDKKFDKLHERLMTFFPKYKYLRPFLERYVRGIALAVNVMGRAMHAN